MAQTGWAGRLAAALRRLPRAWLLAAIRGYQRHLSPHKGFACAYRVHTGRRGCSALGARAVRRHGVRRGLALLRERTRRCGDVHRRLQPVAARPPAAQRGDCDCALPCDPGCDSPCAEGPCADGPCGDARSGRTGWRVLDVCDCCGGCDLPRRPPRQPAVDSRRRRSSPR